MFSISNAILISNCSLFNNKFYSWILLLKTKTLYQIQNHSNKNFQCEKDILRIFFDNCLSFNKMSLTSKLLNWRKKIQKLA